MFDDDKSIKNVADAYRRMMTEANAPKNVKILTFNFDGIDYGGHGNSGSLEFTAETPIGKVSFSGEISPGDGYGEKVHGFDDFEFKVNGQAVANPEENALDIEATDLCGEEDDYDGENPESADGSVSDAEAKKYIKSALVQWAAKWRGKEADLFKK